MTREECLQAGIDLMHLFCLHNRLKTPEVFVRSKEQWRFDACAFYRPTYIEICPAKCAHIGSGGRAWSYPGYIIDRTPYGVIQHELGHHADVTKSRAFNKYSGDYSARTRNLSGEPPITGYAPDVGEWFAEMFRLFVTNPELLRAIRPRVYYLLIDDGFVPVIKKPWRRVLIKAPPRTKAMAIRRVQEAKHAR